MTIQIWRSFPSTCITTVEGWILTRFEKMDFFFNFHKFETKNSASFLRKIPENLIRVSLWRIRSFQIRYLIHSMEDLLREIGYCWVDKRGDFLKFNCSFLSIFLKLQFQEKSFKPKRAWCVRTASIAWIELMWFR